MSHLKVSVTDGRGRAVSAHALAGWIRRAAPAGAHGSVSIALVSDRAIRGLNRRYRRVDRVTDVLSFPAGGPQGPEGLSLGDIAIARGVAQRQARGQGHSLQTELRVLALHGLLHLLGYDHQTDRGQMRHVEERLRRRAGLRTGLIARARGGGPGR